MRLLAQIPNRKLIFAPLAQRCIFLLLLSVLLLGGCGGPLYKVATRPQTDPPVLTTNENKLAVGVKILDGDEALAQFGANLPLAEVLPLDVRLANQAEAPLPLDSFKFDLRDSAGRNLKLLEPKKALGRVMDFYGNRLYNPEGYRQTRENYEALALRLNAPLAVQEERRGLLFFEVKDKVDRSNGLTLSIVGGPTPLKLNLN